MTTSSTSTVAIRPAEPADAGDVGQLTVQAYLADHLLDPDDEYAAELADGAGRIAEATVLVAQVDGVVAGSITLAPYGNPWAEMAQPGEVELRMLAVRPDMRRRGIAKMLATAAIAAGREMGAQAIILCSMDTMTTAHRMYDQMGFVRVPQRDWGVPDVHLLAYRMEL